MLDSSRQAIEELRALERAWKDSGQTTFDKVLTLGEVKMLIAGDVQDRHGTGTDAARDAFREAMKSLRKGISWILADETAVKYFEADRTFHHMT